MSADDISEKDRKTELISRVQAKSLGLLRYFTGKPCSRGHIAQRQVSNFTCFDCAGEDAAKRYKANPVPSRERANSWRLANREIDLAKKKATYYTNREDDLKRRKEWSLAHPGADNAKWKKFSQKWKASNPGAEAEMCRFRQASLQQRTPKWADRKHIRKIYALCPKGWHVDHEIPLRGKLVSGLHVPENLVIVPAKQNHRKGNRFTV